MKSQIIIKIHAVKSKYLMFYGKGKQLKVELKDE